MVSSLLVSGLKTEALVGTPTLRSTSLHTTATTTTVLTETTSISSNIPSSFSPVSKCLPLSPITTISSSMEETQNSTYTDENIELEQKTICKEKEEDKSNEKGQNYEEPSQFVSTTLLTSDKIIASHVSPSPPAFISSISSSMSSPSTITSTCVGTSSCPEFMKPDQNNASNSMNLIPVSLSSSNEALGVLSSSGSETSSETKQETTSDDNGTETNGYSNYIKRKKAFSFSHLPTDRLSSNSLSSVSSSSSSTATIGRVQTPPTRVQKTQSSGNFSSSISSSSPLSTTPISSSSTVIVQTSASTDRASTNSSSSLSGTGNISGDASSQTITTIPRSSKQSFRSGKWTTQEEAYAHRLIEDFTNGLLEDVDEGSTMRSWLSKQLNCCPMRISKKFVGSQSIGKRMFKKNHQLIASFTADQIRDREDQLQQLKKSFHDVIANENHHSGGSGLHGGNGNSSLKKNSESSNGRSKDVKNGQLRGNSLSSITNNNHEGKGINGVGQHFSASNHATDHPNKKRNMAGGSTSNEYAKGYIRSVPIEWYHHNLEKKQKQEELFSKDTSLRSNSNGKSNKSSQHRYKSLRIVTSNKNDGMLSSSTRKQVLNGHKMHLYHKIKSSNNKHTSFPAQRKLKRRRLQRSVSDITTIPESRRLYSPVNYVTSEEEDDDEDDEDETEDDDEEEEVEEGDAESTDSSENEDENLTKAKRQLTMQHEFICARGTGTSTPTAIYSTTKSPNSSDKFFRSSTKIPFISALNPFDSSLSPSSSSSILSNHCNVISPSSSISGMYYRTGTSPSQFSNGISAVIPPTSTGTAHASSPGHANSTGNASISTSSYFSSFSIPPSTGFYVSENDLPFLEACKFLDYRPDDNLSITTKTLVNETTFTQDELLFLDLHENETELKDILDDTVFWKDNNGQNHIKADTTSPLHLHNTEKMKKAEMLINDKHDEHDKIKLEENNPKARLLEQEETPEESKENLRLTRRTNKSKKHDKKTSNRSKKKEIK